MTTTRSHFWLRAIRRVNSVNEPAAKTIYQTGLAGRVVRRKPVILYSAGKTGSTSVRDAIAYASDRPVLHVHRTTPMTIGAARRVRLAAGANARSVPDWRGEVTRALIDHDPRGCDIVTLTREPVGRAVSAFFHEASEFGHLDGFEQGRDTEQMDATVERFLSSHVHPASVHWFDWELKKATGVDVVRDEPDSTIQGDLYHRPGLRLLVVRYEDLGDTVPKALAEFLGVSRLTIPRRNVTAQKSLGDTYTAFRRVAKLPDWYLSAMYSARATRRFYTPGQLETFRSTWSQA